MQSLTPIPHYEVLRFADVESAVRYCVQILDLLLAPQGIAYAAGADRAVMWLWPPGQRAHEVPEAPSVSGDRSSGGCYVFASEGAVKAAAEADVHGERVGRIPGDALPPGCALVFGDAFVDRRASPPRRAADAVATSFSPSDQPDTGAGS